MTRALIQLAARTLLCVMCASLWVAPASAKPPAVKRARVEKRAKPRKAVKTRRDAAKPAQASDAESSSARSPAEHGAAERGPNDAARANDAPRANNADAARSNSGESRADAQRRAAQDAALGADAQVVREGDTQVKVMSFSGLDIEGRLKSPQLLYFIGRVRAEFDRPTLPHRSFMPELDGTTHTAPLQ